MKLKQKNKRKKNLYERWKNDPLLMQRMLWPKVKFYDKQREMIESVRDNKKTFVTAGNMLGKDFVAGFIVLWYFLCHYSLDRQDSSVRIITTSVKADHLRVLWAEVAKFISSSKIPLLADKGGPLVLLNMEIRHRSEAELKNPINYLMGQVSAKGEGLSGHHAKNAMIVVDEASGVEQVVLDHALEWANKVLVFGNPNPCNNFFFKGVKEGDLKLKGSDKLLQKVIRIKAEDSPNVKYALAEKKAGKKITNKRLLPGVLTYEEYIERRQGDAMHQT